MPKKSKSKSKSKSRHNCPRGKVWRKGYTTSTGKRVTGRCVKKRGKSKSPSKGRGRPKKLSKKQRRQRAGKQWRKLFGAAQKRAAKKAAKEIAAAKKLGVQHTKADVAELRRRIRARELANARADYHQYLAESDEELARERKIVFIGSGKDAKTLEKLDKQIAKAQMDVAKANSKLQELVAERSSFAKRLASVSAGARMSSVPMRSPPPYDSAPAYSSPRRSGARLTGGFSAGAFATPRRSSRVRVPFSSTPNMIDLSSAVSSV